MVASAIGINIMLVYVIWKLLKVNPNMSVPIIAMKNVMYSACPKMSSFVAFVYPYFVSTSNPPRNHR